jgi:outer membrane biosynthesis protein TonB
MPPTAVMRTAPDRACHTLRTVVSTIVTFTLTATVGDPSRTRTVYAAVLFLVALAIVLVVVAMWLVRVTRPDPEVLAPLELMGTRSWRRADPVGQRRLLDDARPAGAQPLDPAAPPPSTDAAFDAGPTVIGFDDLAADPEPEPEPDPEPVVPQPEPEHPPEPEPVVPEPEPDPEIVVPDPAPEIVVPEPAPEIVLPGAVRQDASRVDGAADERHPA